MKLLLAIAYFLITAVPALADDKSWKPVDQVKAPVVEKDADAEVIFWEVFVDIGSSRVSFSHYIRIKIFTERGRDSQSKVDLIYVGKNKIEDIAGRTIKADGTIIELKKDAVFDRIIAKGNKKLKSKPSLLPCRQLNRRPSSSTAGARSAKMKIFTPLAIPARHTCSIC